MYRLGFALFLSSFILFFSFYVKNIRKDLYFVKHFNLDVYNYFNKKPKHNTSMKFYEDYQKHSFTTIKDSLNLLLINQIGKALSCLKIKHCENSIYITRKGRVIILNELSGFESKIVSIDNTTSVDFENNFLYYSFITNFFEIKSIEIIKEKKNLTPHKYHVYIHFHEYLNSIVYFEFKLVNKRLKLNLVEGFRELFEEVDELLSNKI
jgi:hypothetical protein